jgi:hypothetical protein
MFQGTTNGGGLTPANGGNDNAALASRPEPLTR